jgi:hypothetical protein
VCESETDGTCPNFLDTELGTVTSVPGLPSAAEAGLFPVNFKIEVKGYGQQRPSHTSKVKDGVTGLR